MVPEGELLERPLVDDGLDGADGDQPEASGGAKPSSAAPPGLRQRPDTWLRTAAPAVVAAFPMLMMLASVIIGGGPWNESADDALITLATRDAIRGTVLLGPYSRFGWHHPGPSYFYLLSIPTWLWRGTPTGSWVGATLVGVAAIMATAIVIRRVAGPRAGWWTAIGALAVLTGVGPGLLRDPWNPYVVALPVLLFMALAALAAAGVPGTLLWAVVVGSFAVQTHISTMPLVAVLLVAAAACQVARRGREVRRRRTGDIPPGLPSLPNLDIPRVWWGYRPELAIGTMVLIAEWVGPVWDQLFGTGNLSKLWVFFTSPQTGNAWAGSWRQVTAMVSITMFQHHNAIHDGVGDAHPLITTLLFVGLAVVAIALGAARRRPMAVWIGSLALLSGAVAVWSVTRIVGGVYRYLLVWMIVLPVLPLVALALALEGIWSDLDPRPRWVRPGTAIVMCGVLLMSFLGVRSALDAIPAAGLTDPDIAAGWRMVAPIVGGTHDAVRIDLADGARWPAAAGLALELERRGHPARVDPPWTLLFGDNRKSNGTEPIELILATSNPVEWPPATEATLLGDAGPTWYFVVRAGPQCSSGALPFGGPACPLPVPPSGPAVPVPA